MDLLNKRDTIKFDDWPLKSEPYLTGAKAWRVQTFIHLYWSCCAFNFHDLEGYRGKLIQIQLEDNHPIFRRPYKLSLSEIIGVQARCHELLDVGSVELSNGKCVCTTVMSSKNDIFGNWRGKKWMGIIVELARKQNHTIIWCRPKWIVWLSRGDLSFQHIRLKIRLSPIVFLASRSSQDNIFGGWSQQKW